MLKKKISQLDLANASLSGYLPMSDAAGTATNKVTVQSILDLGSGGGGNASFVAAAAPSGFPASGVSNNLYIATDSSKLYTWDSGNGVYIELGPETQTNYISAWDNPVISISDLAFWGSAGESSTLTLSGSTVTEWRDRAGSSVVLNNIEGSPTLVSNGINSLPAIQFDGFSAIYGTVATGLAKIAPFSVCAVLRPTATTFAGQNASRVVGFGGSSIGDYEGYIHFSEYNTNDGSRPYFFGGTSTSVWTADYTPYIRGSALSITNKFMAYVFDGTDASVYENGVLKGTNSAVHSTLTCNNSVTASLSLGAQLVVNGALGEFGKFYISEVCLYRKALSQLELKMLNGYFALQYAII